MPRASCQPSAFSCQLSAISLPLDSIFETVAAGTRGSPGQDRFGDGINLVHVAEETDDVLIKPNDHAELWQRATGLKRTLTALLQKLNADR